MREISEIIGIIKELKKLKSDTDVARVLGMKQSAFSERKKLNSIPYEQIALFCEKEELSLDWLLLGREPDQKEKEIGELRKLLKSVEKKLK